MPSLNQIKRQSTERVYELAGRLADDLVADAEWQELQALLTHSPEACRAYVEAMLLQASLHSLGKEGQIG